MAQVENGNKEGNNDRRKTGRGLRFSGREPQMQLKGRKGHLRQCVSETA